MSKLKHFALAFILLLAAHQGFAAPVISTAQAYEYVGKYVTVTGYVTQVHVSRKGHTYLNMDGRYPRNPFTAVIFRENAGLFPDVFSFQGQQIKVSGYVELYRGKPEIIIKSRSQISGNG